MSYRRCLSIRASLLARRSNPPFCYVSHEDDRGKPEEYLPSRSAIDSYVWSFRSYVKSSSWRYSGVSFGVGSGLVGSGLCENRYMSTWRETLADELKKFVMSKYPILGEIIPAAESSLPVLAVQYLIDGAHSFTGLNWWASIALTTLLIRGVTIPFLICEAKNRKKYLLTLQLQQLWVKEISKGQHIMEDMDPESLGEMVKRLKSLPNPQCRGLGTFLQGMAIRGPVSTTFILAVMMMVDKVPSFKSGGAFWFTDLTAHDPTFILPSLTLLSFLACFRSFWREKFEMVGALGSMEVFLKWHFRAITICSVPMLLYSLILPEAIYCYMLTSNVFSLCIYSCLKNPNIRKALCFPEMPVPPPSFFSVAMGREKLPSFLKG